MNVQIRLKNERVDRGLSQEQLASICGVTKQAVSKWEAKTAIPSDKLTFLAAEGFDVLYIITGERNSELVRNPELDSQQVETDSLERRLERLSYKRRDFIMTLLEEFEREIEEAERKKAEEEEERRYAQERREAARQYIDNYPKPRKRK